MRRFAFAVLVLASGCFSSDEVEHNVRANLCKKRGAFWIYVTESRRGNLSYQNYRCIHYDTVATRDTVLWP